MWNPPPKKKEKGKGHKPEGQQVRAGEAEEVRQAPEAGAGEVPLLQREVAEARSSFPMP